MKNLYASLDFQKLFDSTPGIYLVLLPDAPKFTMVAANKARLQATMTDLEQTIGRGLFELFPDNPDDPNATGVSNLRNSLVQVVETRRPDTMAVQKYDIPKPDSEGGGFEERFWSPLNTPVLDEKGQLIYIIHRVEDVTEFMQLKKKGMEQQLLTGKLQEKVQKTEAEVFARAQQIQESNRKLQEAHTTLEKLYERVKSADHVKTQFFANVSHEFRTPLTLILGPLDELLLGTYGILNATQKEQLDVLHRNSLRLLRLVNTLLDFSRLEAGRVQAIYESFDLPAFTSMLASSFHTAIVRAGMTLKIRCLPITTPVYVDKDMWEKIVLNLVSNAYKYTLIGEIEISLEANDTSVELRVRDTGTGIPEHEISRVFERFHRVEGAQGRTHEGTGIGLSLVQELVKLHGGKISVESALGKGSTFTVRIPTGFSHLPPEQVSKKSSSLKENLNRSEAYMEEVRRWTPVVTDQEMISDPSVPQPNGIKKKIVLADDNADMREYVRNLLQQHYLVIVATNGQEALEAITKHNPDLVVSDVMMPVLDGIGLLRALRANPKTNTLPIILLSARAGDESKTDGIESGADDYVTKPFSAKELLARVQTQIHLAEMRAHLLREMEFSNQELDAFSRSVSHDLKAPIRSMTGFSQILLENYAAALDDKGKEYLQRIFSSAEKMGQLVDGLLKLSQLSRGELTVQQVNLSKIAEKVIAEIAQPELSSKYEIKVMPNLMVTGDPQLLEVVLQNLFSNAYKFSSKVKHAKIEFGLTQQGQQNTYYVRDNGVGFDMQYANKLFGVFERLHSSREFEGTGVGLATVQRIIQRHHGRIWAESKMGVGTTFYFTL